MRRAYQLPTLWFAMLMLLAWQSLFAERALAVEPAAARQTAAVFQAATAVRKAPSDDDAWQHLLGLVAAIRDETFRRAERPPFTKDSKLADPQELFKLPVAGPGLHSLAGSVRYAASYPPGPGGSYINTVAAVIGGDLVARGPDTVRTPGHTPGTAWDGYISDSIVIVEGRIDTTSYIYSSIVIAQGPIRLQGYINDSLVISVGEHGESRIDVPDGYLWTSLLVAKEVTVGGYVKDSIVYGDLTAEDLRGAEVRKPDDLLRVPAEITRPVGFSK